MNKQIIQFDKLQEKETTEKEMIVKRLLEKNQITTNEAIILLKTIGIQINTNSVEMSSGAKIVGGSDFETTDMG